MGRAVWSAILSKGAESDRSLSQLRIAAKKALLRFAGCEQGQALVEFALTLPVLLLIVTGIFAYGIALNNMLSLTNATSTGARQFALMRGQGGDACAVSASAIAAAAPLLQNTGSTTGIGYSIVVSGVTYSTTSPTCANAVLTQGQPVKITTTYPCSLILFGVSAFPSCKLTAVSSEVIQ